METLVDFKVPTATAREHFLPFCVPDIGEAEIEEVVQTLRSGWITTGPRTKEFERLIETYIGAKHAVAVNSCTGALQIALAAIGIGPGDEVITSPLTFCSTANVIIHLGATPIFADIGDDFNIDPAEIEKHITARTKAIIPVHYSGQPWLLLRSTSCASLKMRPTPSGPGTGIAWWARSVT
jgi:dTDP-4-amino-4,6-dideoxygalactose transaminase